MLDTVPAPPFPANDVLEDPPTADAPPPPPPDALDVFKFWPAPPLDPCEGDTGGVFPEPAENPTLAPEPPPPEPPNASSRAKAYTIALPLREARPRRRRSSARH